MKSLVKLFAFLFLLTATSCHAQKIVQRTADAKKLEINKDQFIGKPFKELLGQLVPKIKYAYGTPDNKSVGAIGGTYIKLFFVDKDESKKKIIHNEAPTGITVRFKLEPKNTRKPMPLGGLDITSEELAKEYGDMIISDIYVSGKN
ncbi:MAG: hypothetical protein ABI359_02595 [Ginsengibacter sp.]